MSLILKDATLADLHAVMSELSETSEQDLLPYGKHTWWGTLKTLEELIGLPGSRAVVMTEEPLSYPLCIFGHNKIAPYIHATWFASTARFAYRGAAATRVARNYLKTLQFLYPGVIFRAHTRSNHPEVTRWFKLLGFRYTGWSGDGARSFTLLPNQVKSDLARNG